MCKHCGRKSCDMAMACKYDFNGAAVGQGNLKGVQPTEEMLENAFRETLGDVLLNEVIKKAGIHSHEIRPNQYQLCGRVFIFSEEELCDFMHQIEREAR